MKKLIQLFGITLFLIGSVVYAFLSMQPPRESRIVLVLACISFFIGLITFNDYLQDNKE